MDVTKNRNLAAVLHLETLVEGFRHVDPETWWYFASLGLVGQSALVRNPDLAKIVESGASDAFTRVMV